ncbi:MAG: Holliday junction resolvase Hjc [Candidatus Woesearchaeota archaeon]|nr:Holliday junction resolvase Hjc [Candidatus Woesearchaeota archaeon]
MNAERDLIHKFWATSGWSAVRIAGSGSMKYPSADVLASNKLRKLAIECKTCIEKNKYLPKEEVKQLKQFADIFGAESWIAIKFKGHEWFFISLADITETAKSFVIDKESIKSMGLLFEELVSK